MHWHDLVNVCGKGGTSEPVCYVCETGGEPQCCHCDWNGKLKSIWVPMLQNENALSASAGSVFYLSSLFSARVKPRPVISRELFVWACTRDTYGWCIVRQRCWCCLNIVSALNTLYVRLSYCVGQTGEMCPLQSSLIRIYEACYCCTRAILLHVNREGCGHSAPEWELFIAKFSKQIYFVRRNPLLTCLFTSVF